MVKYTKKDKNLLIRLGYLKKDISQIEEATSDTKIYLINKTTKKEKRISKEKARKLLGDEQYFSGLGRSCFHWSSLREVNNEYDIYFDTGAYFQ